MAIQAMQPSDCTNIYQQPTSTAKIGQPADFGCIFAQVQNCAIPATAQPYPAPPAPKQPHIIYYNAEQGSPESYAPAITNGASDWDKYRDEQLLSNPGGENYFVSATTRQEKQCLSDRVGKDLSDVAANIGNFFHNLLFGAESHYRDAGGNIQESQERGLVSSLVDLASDLGSALTFGGWRPDGEEAPQGLQERVCFAFDKLKEAITCDVVAGVGGSVNQMGEDLIMAGWNLVEIIPDATLSNADIGNKIVSSVFDNGQVAIDYLTDVLPGGEAWLRVHATNLNEGEVPIFYNLATPENFTGDTRWERVSNTPLRKALETIGSLLADSATLMLLGQLPTSSQQRH